MWLYLPFSMKIENLDKVFVPQMFAPGNGQSQSWQRVGCLLFQASRARARSHAHDFHYSIQKRWLLSMRLYRNFLSYFFWFIWTLEMGLRLHGKFLLGSCLYLYDFFKIDRMFWMVKIFRIFFYTMCKGKERNASRIKDWKWP